jgi:hypothetical protein
LFRSSFQARGPRPACWRNADASPLEEGVKRDTILQVRAVLSAAHRRANCPLSGAEAQFAAATCRFDKENFAVGLTLLFFGLFEKAVLADHRALGDANL